MRKLAGQLGSEIQVEHHRSKWPSVLMALILLVGLGPLALEGVALCMGTWKDFLGIAGNVKTPILDSIQDGSSGVPGDCSRRFIVIHLISVTCVRQTEWPAFRHKSLLKSNLRRTTQYQPPGMPEEPSG